MNYCNPLLELRAEQDRLRERYVTANEIQRRFPRASKAFLERNLTPSVGVQGAQPQPSSRISVKVEASRKENGSSRCEVCITSYRRRLIDPDNLFVKPCVDALRYEGLIADDSAAHIILKVGQKKVSRVEDECTVVEIG